MCLLGIRVVISKRATQELGTAFYIAYNFYVEFALGLVLLVMYWLGGIEMKFDTTRLLILAAASLLAVVAEFLLFQGILIGVVGVVVAFVASNFVLVAILGSMLGKTTLNGVQIVGIIGSLLGVVVVTTGDLVL